MSAIALIAAAAMAGGATPLVEFPGPRTSVRSPTSPARVYYVGMGMDQRGQNLSLRFDPGNGRATILKRFDRSVDIGWSPSGERFLVNDYIGSNIADCLIVRPRGGGVRGVSLIRAVARSPGRPPENPANSHYAVLCDGWRSDSVVFGSVSGHTDSTHSHEFDYRFSYDAATGRLSWRHH